MIDSYLRDGVIYGSVAQQLLKYNCDPGALRPFIGEDGNHYMTVNESNNRLKPNPVTKRLLNNAAIFFYDEWKAIDREVVDASQPLLRAWNDLAAANTFAIPGGWSKTVLESSMMGDITGAEINMEGIAVADQDFPLAELTGVPLPIIHKDAIIPARTLAVSRQGNMPLDTTFIRQATVKVAQEVEKMVVGVGIGYSYAGYNIWGYTNFPGRITVELTDPDDVSWEPQILIDELIEMRQALRDAGFQGPYKIYLGSRWDSRIDKDYSETKGDNTLRDRILKLDGISGLSTLDYLQNNEIIMLEMTPRVARAIVGMPMTTMQWEEMGGLKIRIKVMTIMVPEIRQDFYEEAGIAHGIPTNS